MPTREQIEATIEVMRAIADTIDEAGAQGIPSGHIYAGLMGYMSLETYQRMINAMKEAGRITESNHVLYGKGGQ